MVLPIDVKFKDGPSEGEEPGDIITRKEQASPGSFGSCAWVPAGVSRYVAPCTAAEMVGSQLVFMSGSSAAAFTGMVRCCGRAWARRGWCNPLQPAMQCWDFEVRPSLDAGAHGRALGPSSAGARSRSAAAATARSITSSDIRLEV